MVCLLCSIASSPALACLAVYVQLKVQLDVQVQTQSEPDRVKSVRVSQPVPAPMD
jgi:hypothetical protein